MLKHGLGVIVYMYVQMIFIKVNKVNDILEIERLLLK